MMSFLKSIFKRAEPDILNGLDALKEIETVTDYCLFDEEGNVLRTGSKLANSESSFASLGKDTIKISLLLSSFAQWAKSDSKFWQMQCSGGSILVWNFGASHLLVLLKSVEQISVVRMTVSIFKEAATESKLFTKYFREGDAPIAATWQNDTELHSMIDIVLGNQIKEKT